MKYPLITLFLLFVCGTALVSSAQTNDAIGTVTNAATDAITNTATNAEELMPIMPSTNSTPATAETNQPSASRSQKEKITIHSEGPYQMDLNDRWITYQDRVRVTDRQMIMTCEWLLANLPDHGEHITNIVAQTNVVGDFVDDKNQKWHVTGDKGVYAYHVLEGVTNETITLTGNPPEIQEGQDTNTMTGDAIIYNIVTKKVRIDNPTSVFWYGTNSAAGTNSMAPKF